MFGKESTSHAPRASRLSLMEPVDPASSLLHRVCHLRSSLRRDIGHGKSALQYIKVSNFSEGCTLEEAISDGMSFWEHFL